MKVMTQNNSWCPGVAPLERHALSTSPLHTHDVSVGYFGKRVLSVQTCNNIITEFQYLNAISCASNSSSLLMMQFDWSKIGNLIHLEGALLGTRSSWETHKEVAKQPHSTV